MTKETRIYNEVGTVSSVSSAGKNWTASCKIMKLEHWMAKGGSQETPGIMGKFGLGGQNEVEQRLTEFWAPKSLQMITAAMKLKDTYSLEENL